MTQECRDRLAREIKAVLTADVTTVLRELPRPHTPAQVWDAVQASAATLGVGFQVQVERDVSRPDQFKVTVFVLEG
jgi:hypothetical protein